jgi:hypothetical protein
MTNDERPDKPPIDIPVEPVATPTDQEEHDVPDEDFLKPHEARDDDTIDDAENPE